MKIYQKDVESSTEYILPDYMGEIKKILTVTARQMPTGRFVNDSGAEFSGIVCYDVLYTDSDGALSSFSTSSDFSASCAVSNDDAAEVGISAHILSSSLRPLGARRVMLKSNLLCNMYVLSNEPLVSLGDAFLGTEQPELLKKTVTRENMAQKESEEKGYSVEAEKLLDLSVDEVEILATSGAVKIGEVTPEFDGVRVKGDIIITSIIRTPDQPPFAISRSIPFDESIAVGGEYTSAFAQGHLGAVSASVSDGGDSAIIMQNANMSLSVFASYGEPTEIICDAYLKGRATEGEYEDYGYFSDGELFSSSDSFSVNIPRTDLGLEMARDIIYTTFEMHSLEAKREGNTLIIGGEAAISGVACEINDDKEEYVPIKFTAPFSISVPVGTIGELSEISYTVTPCTAEATFDADMLLVKCYVNICLHTRNKNSIRRMVLCNVVPDGEYKINPAQITVYYPDADETLFGIAKKFHRSAAALAKDNEIAEDAIASVASALKISHLIIK